MSTVDISTLSSMLMQTTTPSDVRASADFVMRRRRKYMRMFGRRYAFFANGTVVAVGDEEFSTDSPERAKLVARSAKVQMEKIDCSKVTPDALRYKLYGYDQATRRMMVLVSFKDDTPGVSNIVGIDEAQFKILNVSVGSQLDAVNVLLAARVNVARANDVQSQNLAYITLPKNRIYSCKENFIVENIGKKYTVISS